MCFRIELEFSTEWLQLPRVRYLSQNRGRKRRTIFVPGEPPVMWLSCRECHILVPEGALVYIGARNISALLWRDQGADVENRRMVFRFPSSFNAHTIPCAMPVFFHYLLHVSLHLLKSSFCFLYCRQSQVVTRYPFAV